MVSPTEHSQQRVFWTHRIYPFQHVHFSKAFYPFFHHLPQQLCHFYCTQCGLLLSPRAYLIDGNAVSQGPCQDVKSFITGKYSQVNNFSLVQLHILSSLIQNSQDPVKTYFPGSHQYILARFFRSSMYNSFQPLESPELSQTGDFFFTIITSLVTRRGSKGKSLRRECASCLLRQSSLCFIQARMEFEHLTVRSGPLLQTHRIHGDMGFSTLSKALIR